MGIVQGTFQLTSLSAELRHQHADKLVEITDNAPMFFLKMEQVSWLFHPLSFWFYLSLWGFLVFPFLVSLNHPPPPFPCPNIRCRTRCADAENIIISWMFSAKDAAPCLELNMDDEVGRWKKKSVKWEFKKKANVGNTELNACSHQKTGGNFTFMFVMKGPPLQSSLEPLGRPAFNWTEASWKAWFDCFSKTTSTKSLK